MSSESESDEDFVPGEPEQVSEEDSADDETDKQYNVEQEIKTKKRQAKQTKPTKKRRKTEPTKPEPVVEEEEKQSVIDPKEEKKREDDLWAMFLEGTDTKSKKTTTLEPEKSKVETVKPGLNLNGSTSKAKKDDDAKSREARIFEFAGEKIVVEDNFIRATVPGSSEPATSTASKIQAPSLKRGSGGLSSLVSQLNKKNTLTTLEKTKLDWDTFKHKEGIEEELQNFNKGKQGYLERKDFLERADLRQYEIERELRMSKRSNR